MKNIFHPGVKEEIIDRIKLLNNTHNPLWGKMNVAQMLTHCSRPLKVVLGEVDLGATGFMLRLIGKFIKRSVVSEKPFKQNLPTSPAFVTIADEFDFEAAQLELIDTVNRFVAYEDHVSEFHHPIMGKLSKDEWARSQYKHLDHHLRQFGK